MGVTGIFLLFTAKSISDRSTGIAVSLPSMLHWHMTASHQGIVCSMHVDGREGRTRRTTNYDHNESKASNLKVPPQLVTTDTEHSNVLTMTGPSALFLFLCWHRGNMGVSPRHIQVFQVSSCKLNVQLPCQCVVIPGL